jgi:hypothetical protein
MVFYLPEFVCFSYIESLRSCSAPVMAKPVRNASAEEVFQIYTHMFRHYECSGYPMVPVCGTWDFTDIVVAVTERLFFFSKEDCPVTDTEISTQSHEPRERYGAPYESGLCR